MKTRAKAQRQVAASYRVAPCAGFLLLGCTALVAGGAPRGARADEVPGIIETVVGGSNGDGRSAKTALVDPRGLAICQRADGAAPDLYIADSMNNRVRRVDGVTGVVSTVAGTGAEGFAGDGGLAVDAQLSLPLDVVCDTNGTLYVADGWSNRRVRKIDGGGRISTIAGNGQHDFSGDNILATQAALSDYALALDAAGNLYIADADNRRVRMVDSSGVITTVAGNGAYGFAHDGMPATQEALGFPSGVGVDADGRLYIADYSNQVVYRVADGIITLFAGDYAAAFGGDGGPATGAHLLLPNRVTVDPFGNVLILDHGNDRVRRVDRTGVITTIAGDGSIRSTGDGGPGIRATLFPLRAVAADSSGDVYIASSMDSATPWSYDNRVRRLNSAGIIDTVVGVGDNGDGPSAADAVIDPRGVATGRQARLADLYIADSRNHQIRKVDGVSGAVSTVAGTGEAGFAGDGGVATAAQLSFPSDVVADQHGNLYVADVNNNRVRRVDSGCIITTVAGNGSYGYNGDGRPAVSAALASPTAVDVDDAGNVYIADRYNNRIRKVTPTGIIGTVAGNGSFSPLSPQGDGGPATQAPLGSPTDVVVAADGSFYVAEFVAHRVRQVRADGIIVPVAGNGNFGAGGDGGLAVNAQLNSPFALALDAQGNLYIGDSTNQRVRQVDVVSGVMTTVAGNGTAGTQGDGGPATSASLYPPSGLAVDASGHLYIAQADSSRVRRMLLETAPAETGAVQPTPASLPAPTATPAVTLTISGRMRSQPSGLDVHDATVQLRADGPPREAARSIMEAATDGSGQFALCGVSGGTWRMQPQKIGGVEDAIGAVDAAYALQAAAGLREIRGDEQLACDVDADGATSAADAGLMLQRAVGLVSRFPVGLLCQSDWVFMPEPAAMALQEIVAPEVHAGGCQPGAIVYRSLRSNAPDQNFSARAFGNCSGVGRPVTSGVTVPRARAARSQPALHLRRRRGRMSVSIYVHGPGTFHALDLQLAYDGATLSAPRVTPMRTAQAALMAANDQVPGRVTISLASAYPMRSGRVLTVDFTTTVAGTRPARTSVSMLGGKAVQLQ